MTEGDPPVDFTDASAFLTSSIDFLYCIICLIQPPLRAGGFGSYMSVSVGKYDGLRWMKYSFEYFEWIFLNVIGGCE